MKAPPVIASRSSLSLTTLPCTGSTMRVLRSEIVAEGLFEPTKRFGYYTTQIPYQYSGRPLPPGRTPRGFHAVVKFLVNEHVHSRDVDKGLVQLHCMWRQNRSVQTWHAGCSSSTIKDKVGRLRCTWCRDGGHAELARLLVERRRRVNRHD